MTLRTTDILMDHCPCCSRRIDCATAAQLDHADAEPTPGCLTICAYCASILVFGRDMSLRLITPADQAELSPRMRAELRRIQQIVLNLPASLRDPEHGALAL